ncbi:hypothetical protein V2G26_011506 [Clonostachys chloroleuca]
MYFWRLALPFGRQIRRGVEHASLSSFLPRHPTIRHRPSILSLIPTTTAICYDGQSWVNRIITMSAAKQVYIAVIGAGGVGKCFLSQLQALAARKPSPKLNLAYIATSRKALFNDDYSAIDIGSAVDSLAGSSKSPLALSQVVDYLAAAPAKAVLVDNTSSQDVAELYPLALSRGISIVTPNKKAFSGSYKLWQDIFSAAASSGAKVYHESSVGAGLPVISTLKDLVETGDKVTKVEGVFSGTMSFLFNSFAPTEGQGGKWSAEVKNAKALGYTEPDPRDDLNGLDVARKLTILARLAGLPVESPTSFPRPEPDPQGA